MPDERGILDDLSTPDQGVRDVASCLAGDLLLLGAGRKIGHGLALLARRAIVETGCAVQVIATSRFNDTRSCEAMEPDGISTIVRDLADDDRVRALPDARDVIYLARQEFVTSRDTALSRTDECRRRYGAPVVTVDQMIVRVVEWLDSGGRTMAKPAHFEARDGRF